MRAVVRAAAIAAVARGGGEDVDRDQYIAANAAILDAAAPFPGATQIDEVSTPYREDESGPVGGYGTRREFSLPPDVRPNAVTKYYEERLPRAWEVVERLDGPVVNFRQGSALLSVNLENWRVHRYEVAIDHRGLRG